MRRRAGLHLRDDRMTLVATTGRRGALQCFTIEAGDAPEARLKAELEARRLRMRRVRVGLARSLVTVKALEVPAARGSQLRDLVAFELERHVPFPPEEIRFDFSPVLAAKKGPLRILVAACERRMVERAVRLLEELRLRPVALTVACHDLPHLLTRTVKTRRAVWAHRSNGMADLLFLGANRRMRLSRTVPVKDGEDLVAEVSATLALLGWRDCEAIWISGEDAAGLLASPALAGLGAPAAAPPWHPAVRPLLRALPAEDYGGAVLALAAALGSRRPALNLLPEALRPRTFSQAQLVTAGMATLTALLGLGVLVAQGYTHQRYLDRVAGAIRSLEPEVKAVERLQGELAQKKRLLETLDAIEKGDLHPLPVMKELTERLPQDAWLRTLSMDRQGLEITGQAGAANQLIPLLENSPSLARVEFTAPVTKAGDKEQFRIKASWKAPVRPPETAAAGPRAPAPRPPQPGARSPRP
jgi:general secretion pathway protein L